MILAKFKACSIDVSSLMKHVNGRGSRLHILAIACITVDTGRDQKPAAEEMLYRADQYQCRLTEK